LFYHFFDRIAGLTGFNAVVCVHTDDKVVACEDTSNSGRLFYHFFDRIAGLTGFVARSPNAVNFAPK
jgi:hypothetical protein